MSDCSENKNPLVHNGTSQAQRLLPGLDRNRFALADEKDYADWITFAGEFASYIKYYNTGNVHTCDWTSFFSADISAQLGIIAIQDIDRYRAEIKERLDFIRDDNNKSSPDAVSLKLNELFSALLTLSRALDETQARLPEEASLKSSLLNLIRVKLAPALKQLIAYHIAAENLGYLNHSFLSAWKILNHDLTDAGGIIASGGLSVNWLHQTDETSWDEYVSTIPGDNSIYNNPLTGFAKDYLSIEHAASHNLFTGIFDAYLTAYTKIISEAESELLKTLENYNAHTAHYALFLSFLKLFRFARNQINTITQSHLDFYYKEVLRLQPRPAVANRVHILGELAKQVDEYLMAAGTALKAGKDSLNREVAYTIDAETVLNKAKVAQLKTFYKGSTGDTLFNSLDKVITGATLESKALQKAQPGFALASHYLYLTEGERKVYIRLVTSPASVLDGKKIECWLTAEKEWYRADSPVILSSGKKFSDNITSCTEISFTIPGSVPAIVNYNPSIHGGTLNCELPILKICLAGEDSSDQEYDLLKDATVSKVEIRVEVGMDSGYNQKGLKNLVLSNDNGPLDASKPFMPFGPRPTPGNRLVIGSREIFSKKNARVKLQLEWKDVPGDYKEVSYGALEDGYFPNISIFNLEDGIWKTLSSKEEIFDSYGSGVRPTKQLVLTEKSFDGSVTDYDHDHSDYGISSSGGFIALQLQQSFGHKEYLKDFSRYMVELSPQIDDTVSPEPVEPYTPVIQSLYASYSAFSVNAIADSSSYFQRDIRFFHLYPFGESEEHKYLLPSGEVFLLPQFRHVSEGIVKEHTGEFYIGIAQLDPGQGVNILFQLLEGTTDPVVAKPGNHIHWSCLGNNRWIDFKTDEYSDNTFDLVQSGIISFSIPEAASRENTVLPAGYIWIRAAVSEAAGAICKLLSVDAQASVATFTDNNNAEDLLDNPLAAGTISKLKIPDASVKKIIQPYPSFGGRQKESSDHFYIRVSERLRHKDRAVTVWDYEHLVLEAFPEIYKVKCLNHTQVEDGIYNEMRPGYVSIITIPSLQNRNDANPLKPFTQQSTLTNIENYLKKRASCFVRLRACQPQFEEIRLEFSLKLHDAYRDFSFYSEKLKEEITQYLSPWAFDNPSSIDFGGKIYKSVLINFIEERYYVDFITDVFMYVRINELTDESGDLDEITASTGRSILVSAPASGHVIHQIIEPAENNHEVCFDS